MQPHFGSQGIRVLLSNFGLLDDEREEAEIGDEVAYKEWKESKADLLGSESESAVYGWPDNQYMCVLYSKFTYECSSR